MDQVKFRWVRKEILVQLIFFFGIIRQTKLFGFRGVYCASDWLTATGYCRWFNVPSELILLALAVFLVILELVWERDWKGLLGTCKQNWLVLAFVGLAGLSLFWTALIEATLYKLIILLFSSLLAIYIGHIFDLKRLIKSMTWFFFAICLVSLFYVTFLPEGIMSNPSFDGAWNGMFDHRNYLGVFMALGAIFPMVNLLSIKKRRSIYFIINLFLLGLISFLLYMSQSATGMISMLISIVLVLILNAWIRWGQNLKPWHYVGFLSGVLAAFILVMTNLDFFLGLLGRNATLTGRLPMWEKLFQNVITHRLWLGYGYGAIWHLHGFVMEFMDIANWNTPVALADNGYIDILLHLGVVGLVVLFLLIIMGFKRATRYFFKKGTLVAAFPILVLVFGIIVNISLSMILETEVLVWLVVVASMVIIGRDKSSKLPVLPDGGRE